LDDGWQWDEAHRFCMRLAYRYASNPSEAEDIAQDALLRAWRRRSTLRDAARRKEWLATIVRNEAFRQHSRVRPDPVETVEGAEGVEDEQVVATVERADLHAALKHLDERDRQLVQLRYAEDLTQEAIAKRLGIPEGTVKVRLHRVRDKLRRAMGAAKAMPPAPHRVSATRRISSAAARGPI
jgi:RNA polymerase sigma-70 factor (ECF subfamily)